MARYRARPVPDTREGIPNMALRDAFEGFYDPEADEFVPTDVAVEIIERFEGDDPKVLVRTLGDAAQGSGEQGSSSGTGGEASGSA
jgi:hypothetical protein